MSSSDGHEELKKKLEELKKKLEELKEHEKIFLEYYSKNFEGHRGLGGLPSGEKKNLVESAKKKLLIGLNHIRKRIQEVEKDIADKEDGAKGGRKVGRRKSKKMSKRSKKKKCRKTRRKIR